MRKIAIPNGSNQHILIVSGASGSGKTTTCAMLENMYPSEYVHVPFDRSRAARPGEFGSRQVTLESMFEKYHNGEYFNLAQVTHGGYSAIRTADVNQVFNEGKVAVLEFPLESVGELEQAFQGSNISIVELIPPSEEERFKRLKSGHKFTDQRIESDQWGAGRLDRYKGGNLLTLDDHDLTLITETNRLDETVQRIHKFMQVQRLTPMHLTDIEKQGPEAVKNLLRAVNIGGHDCLKSGSLEKVDKEFFIDRLNMK